MKILIILNEAPYGSEKVYNAMRLAMTLQREQSGTEIWVFLLADAVLCTLPNQITPQGYYNLERMFKAVISRGGQVKICASCAEARGIKQLTLIDGVELGSMSEMAEWVAEADKTITF